MQEQVFPQLVENYYAALYGFALSLTKNSSNAGDLTQQTFLVWAAKGHVVRDLSKVKTWLFTTLYREFLHTRRRDRRSFAIEDLASTDQELPNLETDFVSRLDAQLVLETLQQIDQVFREPLVLFYLQALSYMEIAEILDVPIGTVMSRLSRGKAQLRALLAAKAHSTPVIPFSHQTARS